MKSLSTKARITFGLVGLTLSAVLLAAMFELVPDRNGAIRDARVALAEALAASSVGWVGRGGEQQAKSTLELVVSRNDDVVSAALRKTNGRVVLAVGPHESVWQSFGGDHSIDTQIRVPVLDGARRWGQLELRFVPLSQPGVAGVISHPLVLLVGFLCLVCFFSFYFYLGKALTQLDPSKAVPGRVRSALDTMAEGLLVIDRSGRVVLANEAFAQMLGRTPDELVGVDPANLPLNGRDEAGNEAAESTGMPWARVLASGESEYAQPMRLRDRDGQDRFLSVNCSAVLSANGAAGGVLVSFDDVTELERRGEELRMARDEADAANQAKSEFLANMSHEIRTPMNAILGFTDLLYRRKTTDPQKAHQYLGTIHRSGTHLLNLINDILDLSKVESGRLDVERIDCPIQEIASDVVRVMRVKADEAGIGLRLEAVNPVPATITSDPVRLRQILTNLVGNAIKFTTEGEVAVRLRFEPGNGNPVLHIAVSDTGVGIAEDKLESVFEAFTQADSSVTRQFGGTGLGLPISRRFARALGGDIVVTSTPGEGSTFSVSLPTGSVAGVPMLSPAEVAASAEAVEDAELAEMRFAPARVLIVDDAPENRLLLIDMFGGSQLTLDEAGNGREALDAVASESYDLILMDMQMPVMDGYTATRMLRERGDRTPVIALTAHAMEGHEAQCREAGCDGFASKPIQFDALCQTMSQWLHVEEVLAQPAAPEPAAEPADMTTGVAAPLVQPVNDAPDGRGDSAAPIVSSLAGSPRLHRAIHLFLQRLPEQVEALESALAEGALDDVASLAHWLKGSGGSVGYQAVVAPAAELEALAKSGDAEAVSASFSVVKALLGRLEAPDGAGAPGEGAKQRDDSLQAAAGSDSDAGNASAEPIVSALAGNQRLHRAVNLFLERLPAQVQEVEDALERSDLAQVAQFAHWLKGSGGSVGFAPLVTPAAELERRAKENDLVAARRQWTRLTGLVARLQAPATTNGPAVPPLAALAMPDARSEDARSVTGPDDSDEPLRSPLAENPRFHRAIALFCDHLVQHLDDIGSALAAGDLERVRVVAHTVKGAAGAVGYEGIAGPARELEYGARDGERERCTVLFERLTALARRVDRPPAPPAPSAVDAGSDDANASAAA